MNPTQTLITPDYIDVDALRLPPAQIFELQMGERRLYYKYEGEDDNQTVKFYIGCTTMLSSVLPESPFLTEWKVRLGEVEAKRVLKERSGYGSFLHGVYGKMLIDKEFDIDTCEGLVIQYLLDHELRADLKDEWVDEVKKDILAFAKWCQDYNPKPILIEGALASEIYGYAGRVDFLGIITTQELGEWGAVYQSGEKKGQPKATKADVQQLVIVDFKSSKSGSFYVSHELQLMLYQQLIAENFPDLLLKLKMPLRIANFAPKNWRSEPSYTFVFQDNKHSWELVETYINLFHQTNTIGSQRILNISGTVSLERYESIAECYESLSLSDIVKPRSERKKQEVPQGDKETKDLTPLDELDFLQI